MKSMYFIAIIFLYSSFLFADEQRKEVGDYNFDGYEDYRVFIMQNGRMALWDYFLFDPEERKYKKHDSLTNLWNPKFNEEDRVIVTFATGGHAGALFTSDIYAWKDEEIQLVESTKQDWDRKADLYVNITMKRMDGVMRINKIILLNSEEARAKVFEYIEKI